MATEKLRAELELITSTAEKDLARFHRSLKSVEKTVTSIGGKGRKSMRPLGEGLSAATANASEFEKSMAAANARVIAFGASAGLIIQVQRALKETVKATVEVEKALTDINIVLNTNTAGLQKFGNQLFKIAGQTGQGFKTVAVAATELARQGLSMEKTLLRTKDALILTRLTGMGAEEAVSSLTAAVNSFNKVGITSTEVINKMAKVDQAFAVSSDDLAKSISRVGSSAVDAGVSMDELLAITTAVQQRTARGGAVIGNAFKTIFTRIGRTDVQKKLAAIGVATRDMQGQMLPATRVLEDLSQKFKGLAQSQQNQIAESVAGVFQVNILRAALGDLSSKYGVYNRALKESASATDEAYRKNERLNETLDAMVNKTLANLTKAGAGIGEATFKPAIENVLSLVNGAIDAFGEGGRFEEFGKGIGKDLLEGLGRFISGPGLAIITIGIGKLAINFASFAKTAVAGVLELNKNVALRKNLEAQVTSELSKQPNIIKAIERGELSAASAARDMLAAMKASNMEASKLAVTSRAIAGNMMGMGAGSRGGRGGGRPGRASGFVPNFADADAERASAAAGGYKAGVIKTMSVPGEGSVMYNGAETVKRFPGMTQPAIMPPQGSSAGSNYQKAFGVAHGFDPYAADGFVPNFATAATIFARGMGKISARKTQGLNTQIEALRTKGPEGRRYAKELEAELEAAALARKAGAGEVGGVKAKAGKAELRNFNAAQTLGLLGLSGPDTDSKSSTTGLDQIGKFRQGSGLSNAELKRYRVTFDNMQSRSIASMKRGEGERLTRERFSEKVSELLTDPIAELSNMVFDKALGDDHKLNIGDLKKKFKGNTQLLPPGAEGSIFEAAVNLGLLTTKTSAKAKKDAFDQSTKGAQKPFDFEEVGPAKPDFKSIFNFHDSLVYADAKRTIDDKSMGTLINKAYNRGVAGLPYMELLQGSGVAAAGTVSKKTPKGKRSASGHVPNFSPLGDAITRERAAGVPVSAIRVSSSPVLKGPGNPGGLGVHNAIDEPAGLGQGISRSRRMGIDPKTHGAAQGLIPNFKRRVPIDSAASSWSPGHPMPLDMSSLTIESPAKSSRDRLTGSEGPRKIDEGGTMIKKAADKFEAATNKVTSGGGLMALSSLGYMAAPAIQRLTGASQGTMDASMMGMGIYGAGKMFLGDSPVMKRTPTEAFKRSGQAVDRLARTGGTKLGAGAKAMRGLKAAGMNFVGMEKGGFTKMGAVKGLARKALLPVSILAALKSGIDASRETEEEKNSRKAEERLAAAQETDLRPTLEQLSAGVSQFSGAFGVSSQKVRHEQFSDIRNLVFGEDGVMSKADMDSKDTKRVIDAYSEFTDSFGLSADAVKKAGDKFNEVIISVAKNLGETMRDLENVVKITGIQKDFADPDLEDKVFSQFTQRQTGSFGNKRWVDLESDAPFSQKDLSKVKPLLKKEGWSKDKIEAADLQKEARKRVHDLDIEKREYYVDAVVDVEKKGKDLAKRVMEMAAPHEQIFKNIGAMQQVSGGSLEQNLNSLDFYEDPVYKKGTDLGRWNYYRAEMENDPDLIPGNRSLELLGISPEKQLGLNALDPQILKAMEDELLKQFKQGGSMSPKTIKAWRSTQNWDPDEKTDLEFKKHQKKLSGMSRDDLELLWLIEASEKSHKVDDPSGMSREDLEERLGREFSIRQTPTLHEGSIFSTGSGAGGAGGDNAQFWKPADLGAEGPPQIDTSIERRAAALATSQEVSEKLRAAQEIEKLKTGEETNKLERQYQYALTATTRGLYGEADIKLKEAKEKARVAYEIEAENIKSRIRLAETEEAKNAATVRAEAIKKMPTQTLDIRSLLKDDEGKDINEISTLTGATNRLAEVNRDLDDVRMLRPETEELLKVEKKLLELRVKRLSQTEKENALGIENVEKQEKQNDNADLINDTEKQILNNRYKYNRLLDLQIRNLQASLTVDKTSYGKEDLAAGRITGSQFAQQERKRRSDLRDAGGVTKTYRKETDKYEVGRYIDVTMESKEAWEKKYGNTDWKTRDHKTGMVTGQEWAPGAEQASMGDIFREEWAQGPRNQAEAFEAGMADVAVTVKDSMKEAIKNIASGADSFKDAMFNVFAAVADKLADQGISMGVDSMFNWLSKIGQNKHGGYIPRGYNQGGVVTGGSGVRDDVMTRMQGGEYVIKKSAAQKIGYETLGAINSYAGGGQARVSLAKEFLYNDPKRPTGGNYNVSRNLSTAALFREDDPQTSEMFGRQSTLTSYLEYRRKEQERRDKILDNIKQQKKQRLTKAYMSAAMRIGVAKFGEHLEAGKIGGKAPLPTGGEDQSPTWPTTNDWSGARGGSPAMVMGGEYIMNPRTVSKYGTGFMSQLNQGRLPSFQSGGLVGGGAAMAAGITTNNVSLSVNIDKSGGATAETGGGSKSEAKNDERGDAEEAQRNKEFAEAIRGAVLKEITKQQRPGGLLRDGATWAAGRRA